VIILGLELNLAFSYDFSKVNSCFKRFVAGSERVFPTSYASFKVSNHFGGKHAPTVKFAADVVKGVVNWYFGTVCNKLVHSRVIISS
jgi:hypothetical protein